EFIHAHKLHALVMLAVFGLNRIQRSHRRGIPNMGFAEIDNDALRVGGVLKKRGQVIAGGEKQLAFDGVIGNLLTVLVLNLAAYINKVRYSAHKHHAGSKDTHDHTDSQVGRCYDHSDGNEHDGGLALGHALERGWLNRMPIEGADGDHDHDGYQGCHRNNGYEIS